jgi:hypothetical protein
MGKGCVRFTKLDDLALNVIGELLTKVPATTFLAQYEAGLSAARAVSGKTASSARPIKSASKKAGGNLGSDGRAGATAQTPKGRGAAKK